jgi:hypothetical protein
MFRLWPLNLNVWTRLPALIALVTAKASTEVSTITTFIPPIPPGRLRGGPALLTACWEEGKRRPG